MDSPPVVGYVSDQGRPRCVIALVILADAELAVLTVLHLDNGFDLALLEWGRQ